MDLAQLAIKISSKDAIDASKNLDTLKGAADRAEVAVDGLGDEAAQSAAQIGQFAGAAKAAAVANDNVSRGIKAGTAAQMALGMSAKANANAQRQLAFQLNDVGVSLASGMNPMMVAIQQGSQMATIYGPGEGGLGRALKESALMVVGLATKIPLLTGALTLASLAFVGLQYEINKTSDVSVSLGDTMLAVFQVIGNGIYTLIQPAINAIAPWFKAAWDAIVGFTHDFVNNIVRLVLGSFELIKGAVMSIPDAFIVAGEAAANGFMAGIEWLVNAAQNAVSNLANSIMDMLPDAFRSGSDYAGAFGFKQKGPSDIKLPRFSFGADGSADNIKKSLDGVNSSIDAIMAKDYAGTFFDAVQQQAVANAIAGQADAANKAGGAAKKAANDNVDAANMAKDAWAGLRKVTEDAANAIAESMAFAKDVTKGFFTDFFSGIEQGKSVWESFKDAALNALGKIVDKLLNNVLDAVFQVGGALGGGGSSGGGGFLSNLFGSLFGGFKAEGGSVSSQKAYVVGERGPEIFKPRTAGDIIPNHAIRPANNNAANANAAPVVNNHWTIDARGAVEGTAEQIRKAIEQNNKHGVPQIAVQSMERARRAGVTR